MDQAGGFHRGEAPVQGEIGEVDQKAKLLQVEFFQALGTQANGAHPDLDQGLQGFRGYKPQGVETGGGRGPMMAGAGSGPRP